MFSAQIQCCHVLYNHAANGVLESDNRKQVVNYNMHVDFGKLDSMLFVYYGVFLFFRLATDSVGSHIDFNVVLCQGFYGKVLVYSS